MISTKILLSSKSYVGVMLSVAIVFVCCTSISNNGYSTLPAFAQQTNNNTGPSSATSGMVPTNNSIIGNTMIPTTTNSTTTPSKNATGMNASKVNPTSLAKNVTSANALLKENTTAPVSPSGISTNQAHLPPSLRTNASSFNANYGANSTAPP